MGSAADAGVAIWALGLIGSNGAALVVNLSAGSIVNDCAGDPGSSVSLGGNHSA